MSAQNIADLQDTIDALQAALDEGEWESCEIEMETGECMWLSRREATQTVREAHAELKRLRHALN